MFRVCLALLSYYLLTWLNVFLRALRLDIWLRSYNCSSALWCRAALCFLLHPWCNQQLHIIPQRLRGFALIEP